MLLNKWKVNLFYLLMGIGYVQPLIGQTPPIISELNCNYQHLNTSHFSAQIIPGTKFCGTICCNDSDKNEKVSLTVEHHPLLSTTFDVLNHNDTFEQIRFCYTPDVDDYKNSPYWFKVTATDSKGLKTEKLFHLNVLEVPSISIESKEVGCGEVELVVKEISENLSIITYVLRADKKTIFQEKSNKTADTLLLKNLGAGEQTIEISTISKIGYNPSFFHTVNLEGGAVFSKNFIQEYQCIGEPSLLKLSNYLINGTSYNWLDGYPTKDRKVLSPSDTIFKIAGVNGICRDTLTFALDTISFRAGFTVSQKSASGPTIVYFTNKSSYPTDYFVWDFGDGNKSKLKNPVHTYSQPGVYTVQLTAEKTGLAACRDTLLKEECIRIFPLSVKSTYEPKLAIYPNPASDFIIITNNFNEIAEVRIYTITGQLAMTMSIEPGITNTSIQHLKEGFYRIHLIQGDHSQSENLVLNK